MPIDDTQENSGFSHDPLASLGAEECLRPYRSWFEIILVPQFSEDF